MTLNLYLHKYRYTSNNVNFDFFLILWQQIEKSINQWNENRGESSYNMEKDRDQNVY